MADNELGTFLRAQREQLSPAMAGLPAGARRRTPGLRRSELATLAGISVEYLARLEQGRDRHPSSQVLAALADALRLTTAERLHLRQVCKASSGYGCLAIAPPASTVRPTVRALLDRLEPSPALVLNRLSDVIAHTTGFGLLAAPMGLLDADRPNVARFVFTDPRARLVYPDWEAVADAAVVSLRIGFGTGDGPLAAFVDELTVVGGRPFAERARRQTLLPERTGVQRIAHPTVGELRLAFETLTLPDADDQDLLVYLPADEQSATAIGRLVQADRTPLRAVPDRHRAVGG